MTEPARTISVLVDNDSWILPFAASLVRDLVEDGHRATLVREAEAIMPGDVAMFLGCTGIVPDKILERNLRNVVVHESDLPAGRGWSPLTWQILEGAVQVPVSLIEAVSEVDAGNIIAQQTLHFAGHELVDEMREQLGAMTQSLCREFANGEELPTGSPQQGDVSHYPRRTPEDSRLDPNQSLAEQFNLLRVVDNDRYPAFFDLAGHRYTLRIEKQ